VQTLQVAARLLQEAHLTGAWSAAMGNVVLVLVLVLVLVSQLAYVHW
jgi:hypothetical protein